MALRYYNRQPHVRKRSTNPASRFPRKRDKDFLGCGVDNCDEEFFVARCLAGGVERICYDHWKVIAAIKHGR
jgi:hypothetical protein